MKTEFSPKDYGEVDMAGMIASAHALPFFRQYYFNSIT